MRLSLENSHTLPVNSPAQNTCAVDVETYSIETFLNGAEARLPGVVAKPTNIRDDEPPKIWYGPFGNSLDHQIATTAYLASIYETPVCGVVIESAHKTLTDPKNQLIDTYKTTNEAGRQLIDTRDQVDSLLVSHGGILYALETNMYGPRGDVIAKVPMGGNAAAVHTDEHFALLDQTVDFEERLKLAIEAPNAKLATLQLLARFGVVNAFAEGAKMLKQDGFATYKAVSQSVGNELFGNMRRVAGKRLTPVVLAAFAAGALVHVAPEFRETREAGFQSIAIFGEKDGVYPFEETVTTLRLGRELSDSRKLDGIRHPHPNCDDGRLLLAAGAYAHFQAKSAVPATI